MIDFEDYDDTIEDIDDVTIDEHGDDSDTTEVGENIGIHTPTDDGLSISDEDIHTLDDRASEIDHAEADGSQISFGRKMCPTRHGCQGATSCDYSYGDYPG